MRADSSSTSPTCKKIAFGEEFPRKLCITMNPLSCSESFIERKHITNSSWARTIIDHQ